jgi:hypothetical protein
MLSKNKLECLPTACFYSGATTFSITTLSITTLSIMTLSITTLSIMKLSITALSITALRKQGFYMTLSITGHSA